MSMTSHQIHYSSECCDLNLVSMRVYPAADNSYEPFSTRRELRDVKCDGPRRLLRQPDMQVEDNSSVKRGKGYMDSWLRAQWHELEVLQDRNGVSYATLPVRCGHPFAHRVDIFASIGRAISTNDALKDVKIAIKRHESLMPKYREAACIVIRLGAVCEPSVRP